MRGSSVSAWTMMSKIHSDKKYVLFKIKIRLMYSFNSLVEAAYCAKQQFTPNICNFHERIHRSGRYHKILSWACTPAKARKSACKTNTKTTATATGVAGCGLANSNKKASPKCEGPGQRSVSPLRTMRLRFDRRENNGESARLARHLKQSPSGS